MKIKEFAQMQGVTPQAVYKLLKTHEQALEGHVLKAKKSTDLDEYAVSFLKGRMVEKNTVVTNRGYLDEIDKLKTELKAAQDELIAKNSMLLAAQNQVLKLTADRDEEVRKIQKELDSFQPTWFGLYKKKIGL